MVVCSITVYSLNQRPHKVGNAPFLSAATQVFHVVLRGAYGLSVEHIVQHRTRDKQSEGGKYLVHV